VTAIITAVVAVVALVGGYVQFVLRRSGVGYIEFDVEYTAHHHGRAGLIGELEFVIRNVGSSMVVLIDVQCRARYRRDGDPEDRSDGVEPRFEHVIAPAAGTSPGEHWFVVIGSRTFVQPGVTLRYRKPIAMPADAQLLHVWGSLDYRIESGRLTRVLMGLVARPPADMDWREGIRHTVRRTFSVAD